MGYVLVTQTYECDMLHQTELIFYGIAGFFQLISMLIYCVLCVWDEKFSGQSLTETAYGDLPSSELTVCYGKWTMSR